MRILAIDIGAGTQDILLFDSGKKIENSISLVLPTPSKVFAERLRRAKNDVYIHGDTIGGGALARAVSDHLRKGCRVVMEKGAAYSIRNDLDEVRSMGIEVGEKPPAGLYEEMEIHEIDLPLLSGFLSQFGEDLDVDMISIAVQDHGVAPKDISDRAFRFERMEALLRKDNRPEALHFREDEIPTEFLRMRSAAEAARRASRAPILVMDTSLSAILGCLDEVAGPSLVVNVGNGHTIAALLNERRIEGLYEHHTHDLTPQKLEDHLRRFTRGKLSNEEVFADDGHGVLSFAPVNGEAPIVVTGPNRDLFRETSLKFIFAAPGGNTMMSGPMGLLKAAQFRLLKRP